MGKELGNKKPVCLILLKHSVYPFPLCTPVLIDIVNNILFLFNCTQHSGVPLKIKRLAHDPERFIWAVGIAQSRCINMQVRIGALVQDVNMLIPYTGKVLFSKILRIILIFFPWYWYTAKIKGFISLNCVLFCNILSFAGIYIYIFFPFNKETCNLVQEIQFYFRKLNNVDMVLVSRQQCIKPFTSL